MADKKIGPWIRPEPYSLVARVYTNNSNIDPDFFYEGGHCTIERVPGTNEFFIRGKKVNRIYFKASSNSDADPYKIVFEKTDSLTTLGPLGGQDITSVANMFTEIIFENTVNTNNVTNIEGLFSRQGRDTGLTITGLEYLNLNNITSYANLFDGTKFATNPDFSFFNKSGITNFHAVFSGVQLANDALDLSSWDFTSADSMSYAFYNTNAKYIILPQNMIDSPPAANMFAMFHSSSQLECLNLLDTTNATNRDYMFNSCDNLTAPDSTTQNDLLNGASWTNPNSCP